MPEFTTADTAPDVIIMVFFVSVFLGFIIHRVLHFLGVGRPIRLEAARPEYDPALYKTREWRALRYTVIKRDGGQCQFCGMKAETAHHRTYAHGIIADPKHLVAVCWKCHNKIHERSPAWN